MKKSVHVSLGLLALWGVCLHAAESRLPSAGIADRPNAAIALTNARVVTEPGKVLERATILLRDGKIEAVGTSLRVPSDAAPLDLQGKTVFAGFIDAGLRASSMRARHWAFPVACDVVASPVRIATHRRRTIRLQRNRDSRTGIVECVRSSRFRRCSRQARSRFVRFDQWA